MIYRSQELQEWNEDVGIIDLFRAKQADSGQKRVRGKYQKTHINFHTLHGIPIIFSPPNDNSAHSFHPNKKLSQKYKLYFFPPSTFPEFTAKQHTRTFGVEFYQLGGRIKLSRIGLRDGGWASFRQRMAETQTCREGRCYDNPFRRMRKHSIPAFIEQTWKMLENAENWTTIGWGADECSFHILDETRFAETLLPQYFKHSNFSSFIRQLNMYNFQKRKTPHGRLEFHHKLFRKNHSQLLIGIRRKPSEAQMLQAEELIRRLAPECVTQNASVMEVCEPAKEEAESKNASAQEETLHREEQCLPTPSICGQTMTGYQLGLWGAQRKIKTNIVLKRPPLFDLQRAAC